MTPEELRELDRELAVGMGRRYNSRYNADGTMITWNDGRLIDKFMMAQDWHPTTDIAQAFEVVDWLIGKGWDFSVSIRQGSLWHALFEQYPALAPHVGIWHEKRSLAICLAAREVMRT